MSKEQDTSKVADTVGHSDVVQVSAVLDITPEHFVGNRGFALAQVKNMIESGDYILTTKTQANSKTKVTLLSMFGMSMKAAAKLHAANDITREQFIAICDEHVKKEKN